MSSKLTQFNSTVEQPSDIPLYTSGMSLGFATGSLILAWTGNDSYLTFYIASLLALVAMMLIVVTGIPQRL